MWSVPRKKVVVPMSDIFISYERSDYARAQRIAEALEQHGWSVWWDRMLLAGNRFDKVIQQALHAAKCVIVLWSKTSISSDWVKEEAFEGAKRQILVPVLIDDVEVPFGLRQIHAARLTNWESSSLAPEFREVLNAVSYLLAEPEIPKTTPVGADVAFGVSREKEKTIPRKHSAVEIQKEEKPTLKRRLFSFRGAFTLAAIFAVALGLLGGLEYLREHGTTQSPGSDKVPTAQKESSKTNSNAASPNPLDSKQTVSRNFTAADNTAPDKTGVGIAIGTLEFSWPGNDWWGIYQGKQLVAPHFGSATQALQAGTYTIKPTNNPVFKPFDVSIKSGSTTKVELGGTLEFSWPGNDWWGIYQGEQLVAGHFGSATQALQAGTYTVKPTNNPVFKPFDIQIVDGHKTKLP
jgi:hypothetical protein